MRRANIPPYGLQLQGYLVQGKAGCLFAGVPAVGSDAHGQRELHGLTGLAAGAAAQHALDHITGRAREKPSVSNWGQAVGSGRADRTRFCWPTTCAEIRSFKSREGR